MEATSKKFKPKRAAAFAQKKKLICYHCGEEGHIKPNCPKKFKKGKKTAMLAVEMMGSSSNSSRHKKTHNKKKKASLLFR